MATKVQNKPINVQINVGYDSSFLSFAIIILNSLSMISKINNINFSLVDIRSFSFLIPIISIGLTTLDSFISYRRHQKDALVSCMKFFAVLAIISSVFIISFPCLVGFEILGIIEDKHIGFVGNLSFIHSKWNWCYFDKVWICIPFIATVVFQIIANILKIFIKRKFEKVVIQNYDDGGDV